MGDRNHLRSPILLFMDRVHSPRFVVLISADVEWRVIQALMPGQEIVQSSMGDFFFHRLEISGNPELMLFFHGGWGKIAAAASAQYVIDRWAPELVINLGTCGGFEGKIERGTIILVERTIVYDIIEQMGDYDEHIAHYSTELDLSWLGTDYPQPVQRTLLVSGDRDLVLDDIPSLLQMGAVAGDWESGAIAWVTARNGTRCLILRGVTDLVGAGGGEAYGNLDLFERNTRLVMAGLLQGLPAWLEWFPDVQ